MFPCIFDDSDLSINTTHAKPTRNKNAINQVFQIRKLRGVKISKEMIPYNIDGDGLEVYPGEKVFT